MTIPLVSSNGTNQVWIGRTNQAIGVINSLTDGALTLNGSITFSNASFSLSLPSLNVNNSIVVTGTGNTVFLNSSNAVVNGTIYAKGSGNALYVTNNAIVTGNVSVNTNVLVGSSLTANGEIIGNANVQVTGIDGQFRAVQGNFGVIFRNDGNSFYILQTGSVSNATTAAFNSMQPLTWNLSTGILTLDASRNGTVVTGNLIVTGANTSLNVSNNVVVQGNLNVSGPLVTITNTANVQGQLTTAGLYFANGGIQMSNTAITFDKPGSTFIQFNQSDFGGNGALQLSGNIQVNGQMVVTGTATFTNTVTFQTATDASLNVTNSAAVGNNLSVVNRITAANGIFTDLHSNGRVIAEAEIVAKLGTGGQFRAVSGSVGGIIRNDGTNFLLLTTGTIANPDTATFNTLRPFQYNLTTGAVTIDATAAGVTVGGPGGFINIGNQAINTGLGLNTSFVTLPNGGGILGKDSGGTVRNLIGTSVDNYNQVFTGPNGNFRVLNIAGTALLLNIDNSGNLQATGGVVVLGGAGVNLVGGTVLIPNNAYLTGRDTGGVGRPLIGTDGVNNTTLWVGVSGVFRVINSTGSAELLTLQQSGNINFNAPLMSTIGSLSVGGVPVLSTPGVVSAYTGYEAKAGTAGGFRSNVFNIDWNGAASGIYIDNTLVAFFPVGTNTSDRRLKTNIETNNTGALDKIRQLRTVSYRLRNNDLCKNLETVAQLGYIADELEQIIPEAVIGSKDAMMDDGKTISPQNLNTTAILAVATQAISELADKYETLEKRITAIEERISAT